MSATPSVSSIAVQAPPLLHTGLADAKGGSRSIRVFLQRETSSAPEYNDAFSGSGNSPHFGSWRRVANEDEVIRTMAREGFSAVQLGRSTLAEKVQALQHAQYIVTPLGANALNLLFGHQAAAWLFLDPPHMEQHHVSQENDSYAYLYGAHFAACMASHLWGTSPRVLLLSGACWWEGARRHQRRTVWKMTVLGMSLRALLLFSGEGEVRGRGEVLSLGWLEQLRASGAGIREARVDGRVCSSGELPIHGPYIQHSLAH